MRILPIYNKTINEDWISNKIRFIYDSNLNQRLKFPLYKLNNEFISISWIYSFFLFFSKLYFFSNSFNIISFFSSLIDNNTLLSMRKFFNLIGSDVFIDEEIYFFNIEFIEDIIVDFLISIELLKIILFIGINLRLEIPILNSKILKNNKIVKMFNIGIVNSYSSNYVKNLGNNIFNLIKILNGKNYFNINLFFKSYFFSGFYYYFKLNNICFFFGQSFYLNKYNNYLFYYFKNFIKNFYFSFCLNIIYSIGYLNNLILGYKIIKNKFKFSNFIFLESVDNFNFLTKIKILNNFLIYRGSFFENGAKYSNLIFPSNSFFEENFKFFNYFGILKNSKKIVHNEYILINNFYEYLVFFYKFYFINNFCVINKIYLILKYFSFLKIEFNFISFQNLVNFNKFFELNIIFIENKIFSSFILNYYKNDVYSRNSKSLHLASMEYLKIISNYN